MLEGDDGPLGDEKSVSGAAKAVLEQHAAELESARLAAKAGLQQVGQYVRALGERGRAQEFVAQQYAGRYALELLQNADDAASDRGVAGRVRFVVGERSLLVADNGTGFGPDQVRALCTLGDSSKDRSKSIGYKGIGFKSVLEITDTPQIFSADVAFGFDGARTRDELARILGDQEVAEVPIPAYAFPIALAPSDAGSDASIVAQLRDEGYTTVVRLPLKETLTLGRIVETLTATITPRLLLLLQGLEELVVEGATDFAATLLRESLGTCTRCILEMGGGALEEWLVYRRSHALGPNDPRPNDPQWRRTTAISTAVAVRIVADAPSPTAQPLHVYFPTEDRCGYPLILHADWALDPDRRHLARSADFEAYNKLVTQHLVDDFTTAVVPDLIERFGGSAGLAECLCQDTNVTMGGLLIGEQCRSALDGLPFLPAEDSLISPSTARLLPERFPVEDTHRWTDYGAQSGSLRQDAEKSKRISSYLDKYGRRRAKWQIPFTTLREPTPEETPEYYGFLKHLMWAAPMTEHVKRLPSIPLQHGGMEPPGPTVFAPTSDRSRSDLSEYAQFARVTSPADLETLRQLGVEEGTWRNLILHLLVPRLSQKTLEAEQRTNGLRALRTYLISRETTDERIRDAVQDVLLPARTTNAIHDVAWVPGKQLYFGREWGLDGSNLEILYGPFGQSEFLAAPDDWTLHGFDEDFFAFLGVSDRPRPIESQSVYWHRFLGDSVLSSRSTALEWYKNVERDANSRCRMGHPQSQWLLGGSAIDRLPEIVQRHNLDQAQALLSLLTSHWHEYEGQLKARIRCAHGAHQGSREQDRPIPNLLTHELQTLEWVPAVWKDDTELVRPENAWVVGRGTPPSLKRAVPHMPDTLARRWPPGMIAAIGVPSTTDSRPTTVVRLLESLTTYPTVVEPTEQAERIGAAEWLLDRLEQALPTPDLESPSSIPLPAREGDEIRFVLQPWATKDPLLEEAFAPALTVLRGAHRFPRVCQAFGLPSLDDAPRSAVPSGPLHRTTREAQRGLREFAPLILSQFAKAHPAKRLDAAETLVTCQARCWSRIDLFVEVAGVTVAVPQTVAYPHEDEAGRWLLDFVIGDGDPVDWAQLGKLVASALGDPSQGKLYALWFLTREAIRPAILQTEQLTPEDLHEAELLLAQYGSSVNAAGEGTERIEVSAAGMDAAERSPADTADDDWTTEPQDTHALSPQQRSRPSVRDILLAAADDPEGASDEHGFDQGPRLRAARQARHPFDIDDLPPVDHDHVIATQPGTKVASDHSARLAEEGHGPAAADLDPDFHVRRNHRGRRAEALVVEYERRRLKEHGLSPDAVVWISEQYPLAAYDLESLDDDGRSIYIEVKATQSGDPSDPFPISSQELNAAREHGSRHWLYRVTRIDDPDPEIVKLCDPYAALERGDAVLEPTKYQMRVGF